MGTNNLNTASGQNYVHQEVVDTKTFRKHLRSDIANTILAQKTEILDKFLGTFPATRGGHHAGTRPLSFNEKSVDKILKYVKTECDKELETVARISISKDTKNEQELYGPLANIMDTIQAQAYKELRHPHTRQIVPKDKEILSLDDPVYGTSLRKKPDFIVADVPPRPPTMEIPGRKSNKHAQYLAENKPYGPYDITPRDLHLKSCSSFIEVKSSYKSSPAYLRHGGSQIQARETRSKARSHLKGSVPSTGAGGDVRGLDNDASGTAPSSDAEDSDPDDEVTAGMRDLDLESSDSDISDGDLENEHDSEGSEPEIDSEKEDERKAVIKGDAMKTLAQGADYAQLIFTGRPFQLFVYGIFISGHRVCIGYFDPCGIVLSPDIPITTVSDDKVAQADSDADSGLRTFIRIILRLTFEMTPVDLGQNPTVKVVAGHDMYAWPQRIQEAPRTRYSTRKDNETTVRVGDLYHYRETRVGGAHSSPRSWIMGLACVGSGPPRPQ